MKRRLVCSWCGCGRGVKAGVVVPIVLRPAQGEGESLRAALRGEGLQGFRDHIRLPLSPQSANVTLQRVIGMVNISSINKETSIPNPNLLVTDSDP